MLVGSDPLLGAGYDSKESSPRGILLSPNGCRARDRLGCDCRRDWEQGDRGNVLSVWAMPILRADEACVHEIGVDADPVRLRRGVVRRLVRLGPRMS